MIMECLVKSHKAQTLRS